MDPVICSSIPVQNILRGKFQSGETFQYFLTQKSVSRSREGAYCCLHIIPSFLKLDVELFIHVTVVASEMLDIEQLVEG